MIEKIQAIISDIGTRFSDRRLQVLDVKAAAALEGGLVSLQGRVLDSATLHALQHALEERLPDVKFLFEDIQVLRRDPACILHVSTNLTSLHAEPSWLAEMLSQNTYGTAVEMLEEQGRWVFVRQLDGYLGWMYRPYLNEAPAPSPTYIVISPLTHIYSEPQSHSPINSRLVGGTCVQVVSTRGGWAEVDANTWGWIPIADLRPLNELARTSNERRTAIPAYAASMIGVPYLWGGSSVHGIDCSGLAQLLHRWCGISIQRDADMQYHAGKKIETPFQPGDLLFFGEKGEKRSITHVAISLGDWRIIHSSRSRNGVYIDEVQEVPHLRDSFIGAATYL
jgi:gamma-D-glutamyl-L-lysine dipeptidyl-peptidase